MKIVENQEYWGVCYGEGESAKIQAVYKNYDAALEESVRFTLETQVPHTVQRVVPKKK